MKFSKVRQIFVLVLIKSAIFKEWRSAISWLIVTHFFRKKRSLLVLYTRKKRFKEERSFFGDIINFCFEIAKSLFFLLFDLVCHSELMLVEISIFQKQHKNCR